MFPNLRKTFSLIERDKRGRWALVAAFTVFVSVIEAAGALVIALIAGLIVSRGDVSIPQLDFLNRFMSLDSDTSIWVFSALAATFFIIRALAIVAQSYAQSRLAHNMGVRLSGRLLAQYLRAPYSFHLRHNSAELIRNVLPTITDLAGSVLQPLIVIFADATLICVLLAVLIVVSDMKAVVAGIVVGGLLLLVLRAIQPRLASLGELNQGAQRAGLQVLQQALQGIREIKLLGKQSFFEHQYLSARADLARAYYQRAGIIEIPRMMLETLIVLIILLVVALSLTGGDSPQGLLVTLGVLAYAGFRILPALNRIVSSVTSFRFGVAAVRIVEEQLEVTKAPAPDGGRSRVGEFNATLALEDVSFDYEGSAQRVLRSLSLDISVGSAIGIVGPTGSGKSTLLDIMTGLLEPSSGKVTVDGVDIRGDLAGWQNQIGFVPQNVFLLDDSLQQNIAIGVAAADVDQGRMAEVIEAAQLTNFVDALPEGLDAVVGERGVRISGGQRQRIAIARALYTAPSLLILDEGTSALDGETEAALMRALESYGAQMTVIMVAHRFSSLRFCEGIVVLEGGAISRLETYDALARSADQFLGD